jgi:hypothetical protein
MFITYHKIVFLVLSKITPNFPPKDTEYSIDINNKNLNLNLILFTLETFDISDLKPLLLKFNHSNILSASHFLKNTPPCYLYLFNAEGKLYGHYEFHIHKPNNQKEAEVGFDNFVSSLSEDIFKNCVYETMKNNAYTSNYKFYMHISNKNIIGKKNKIYL